MTATNLKVRTPVPFPAQVVGAGGIKVSKQSGIWTIEPDFAGLAEIQASNVSDPTTKQIWIFDPISGEYNVLTLAGLGEALYVATSTSSLAIGVGAKTFATQSGKGFPVGSWVYSSSDADPTNFMVGQVTSYVNGSLVVNVTAYGGSGTHADWTLRASSPPGAVGKSAGHSYLWNTSTSNADPGSGKIAGNNATIASVTALYISETDHDGNALAPVIATWDDSSSVIHGRIKIYDPVTPTNFAIFDVTGANTDNGAWDMLNVSHVDSGGAFTDSLAVAIIFIPNGDKGDPSGVPWNFSTNTAMADPAAGNIRLNNASFASVTAVAVSANSADVGNPSVSAYVNTWDDSSSAAHRGILIIRKAAAPQNFVVLDVTGATTDNTTWLQLAVTYVIGNGSFSASDQLSVTFYRTGNTGTGDMTSTNNLSDLANIKTARANLGVEVATGHGDSNFSMAATDLVAYTNAAFTASRTWTMPAANAVNAGRRMWVIDIQGTVTSANTLVIARNGTDTLQDVSTGAAQTSITLTHALEAICFESDGVSKWTVIEWRRSHLRPDASANLTAGFSASSFGIGTVSSGTTTLDPLNGNIQDFTNNGASTLAPPTAKCSIVLDQTNGASAGTLTRSGFTKVTGDTLATTNGLKYRHYITVGVAGSHCHTQAMQ